MGWDFAGVGGTNLYGVSFEAVAKCKLLVM